jgi:hypothetical protein
MPHQIIGPGSIDRRPDTFSANYLFAHAWGPVALSDFSKGLLNRPWRIRADNATKTVYLARANDANDAWEAETVVFTWTGIDLIEMDACFDQQGRIFVCAERASGSGGASEIWAYYFDSLLGQYTFVAKTAGRTPKCVLDDVVDTTLGDVLLFYVNPASGVCWRQQRDRYNTEIQIVFGNIVSVGPLQFEKLYGPGTLRATGRVPQNSYYATGGGPPFLFTPTHIRGNDPGPLGNVASTVEIHFQRPIEGFEFEAVDAHFDGGTAWAINAAGGVIGTVAYPNCFGAEGPRPRRSFYAPGIMQVWLLPSAADYTSFDNIWIAPTETTYIPPAPSAMYLEDAFKAEDSRVHLLYSVRNTTTGQYDLLHYESLLYPLYASVEAKLLLGVSFGSGAQLHTVLIVFDSSGAYAGAYPTLGETQFTLAAAITGPGILVEALYENTLYEQEGLAISYSFNDGSLVDSGETVISHSLYEKEGLTLAAGFRGTGGVLDTVVILHTLYDIASLALATSFGPGGTLV